MMFLYVLVFSIEQLNNEKKLVGIMSFSTYYAHSDPLFKDMEILIIDKLVTHRTGRLMYMYKLNSGLLPKVLCNNFLNNEIHNYNTRIKDIPISHESQTFSSVGAKFGMHLV